MCFLHANHAIVVGDAAIIITTIVKTGEGDAQLWEEDGRRMRRVMCRHGWLRKRYCGWFALTPRQNNRKESSSIPKDKISETSQRGSI